MNEEYETVHTMTGYWDGPRSGIANFKGAPHLFESLFDDEADEWTDTFLLSPVDDETFQLALEDWGIGLRWLRAWKRGEAPPNSHPALPEERTRYEQLKLILEERMKINPDQSIKVKAAFKRPIPNVSLTEAALVKWIEVSE